MQGPSERPRVGVTLSRQSSERTRQSYLEALEMAGAEAIALFPDQNHGIAELDGLVLSGGGDVHPSRYGQPPHESLTGVDDERDEFEIRAIDDAMGLGKPILAICRGHQIANVAFGGSLEQHIESGAHKTPEGLDPKTNSARHGVTLADGSWLSRVYGSTAITVNSRHHQGIRQGMLASGLRATAWSDDGFVEGYERLDGGRWIVGVQWHPERVEINERDGFNEQSAALMAAFVREVREKTRSKGRMATAGTRK